MAKRKEVSTEADECKCGRKLGTNWIYCDKCSINLTRQCLECKTLILSDGNSCTWCGRLYEVLVPFSKREYQTLIRLKSALQNSGADNNEFVDMSHSLYHALQILRKPHLMIIERSEDGQMLLTTHGTNVNTTAAMFLLEYFVIQP